MTTSRTQAFGEASKQQALPETWFTGEGKFIPQALGDRILGQLPIRTLKGSDRMYRYDGGLYVPDGKEEIRAQATQLLGKKFQGRYISDVAAYVRARTYVDPAETTEWLNLENGLLNPRTREFREHSPEVFTTARLPVTYDPKAKCTLFEEKLSEKVDPDVVDSTQEFFGYTLVPGQPFQRALLAYGPPRTMKSTTFGLLGEMLGSQNITAYTLQTLGQNEFAVAYLYNRLANICPDLPRASLKNVGPFMTITGGDAITAARKHEHPITFTPGAKLIFSTNQIPATSNKNLAFYRRWLILPFLGQTPEDNVDPNLKRKLLEELSGILNWSLDGLDRLLKNGRFTAQQTDEEIRDLYEKHSDSIASFIFNKMVQDDDGVLKKRVVYRAYLEYCKQNRLTPDHQIKFGRRFKEEMGCGTCKEGKIPAYAGVSFKTEKKSHQTDVTGGRV